MKVITRQSNNANFDLDRKWARIIFKEMSVMFRSFEGVKENQTYKFKNLQDKEKFRADTELDNRLISSHIQLFIFNLQKNFLIPSHLRVSVGSQMTDGFVGWIINCDKFWQIADKSDDDVSNLMMINTNIWPSSLIIWLKNTADLPR